MVSALLNNRFINKFYRIDERVKPETISDNNSNNINRAQHRMRREKNENLISKCVYFLSVHNSNFSLTTKLAGLMDDFLSKHSTTNERQIKPLNVEKK